MSAAFDAFLVCQNPAPVILAEIQPAQALGPWTTVGGLTSTYSCPFSAYVATSVVAGGLYRRLDQVRQNATLLTVQTSSAAVDAHRGSYYFDSANSLLYVSMTDGGSPETWAFVGAWFTIFAATASVRFSDQPLYEPRIAQTLPTLDSEKPDLLFGATISDSGSIALLNSDGLFDQLSKRWIWRNKIVTFKLGGTNGDTGVALAYSDYATIGTMLINTVAPDDELCTLQLDTMGSVLNRSIPPRVVLGELVDVLDPTLSLANVAQPWLLGTAVDCKLVYIGTTGTLDNYLATDDETPFLINQATATIYAVDKSTGAKTVLTSGTDYFFGGGGLSFNLTFTATSSFPHTDFEIWMDATTLLTPAFGSLVSQLLTALGVPTTQIDSTAFTLLDEISPTLGVYLTAPQLAADVVRTFEQSLNAQLYVRPDGVWSCRSFDPSLDQVLYTLTDTDFATWTTVEGSAGETLAPALEEVRIQYNGRQASGVYAETASDDSTVANANETSDTTSLQTYLRTEDAASALAAHDQFLKGSPPCRVTAEMRGLSLMTASVGDMVAITRARGPIARTGRLDGQLFEIVKLTKDLALPSVTCVLEDLGGQTDRIARCTPDTFDDWSVATDAERAQYGWCCDDNGYLDATDLLTRDLKVGF